MSDVVVRPRNRGDIEAVARIAAAVQAADGYPGAKLRDLTAFVASSDALAAWVAERDGVIAGHVALHPESLPVVMGKASDVLGVDASRLAAVARLIVDPAARRCGIGRALLEAAAGDARRRGLVPILDVVSAYAPAIALYERCGWRKLGEVRMVFPDVELDSYVFVAPLA